MTDQIKAYAYFLAFLAVTKVVVAPIAKQMNIPMISNILE